MSLLTGFRNLIGRKREPRIGEPAVTGAGEGAVGDIDDGGGLDGLEGVEGRGVTCEIEAKPPEPEVREVRPGQDDLAGDDESDREVIQRLDDLDVRLGARGTETQRLVKELDGRIEASTGRTDQLVQRLGARVESQAADARQLTEQLKEQLTEQFTEQLKEKFTEQLAQTRATASEITRIGQQCASLLERLDEQVDRSQDHDDLINVAVGAAVETAAARFGEALDRFGEALGRNDESLQDIRAQIESTARSVRHGDERSEGLVDAVRDIQGRTAGLDDAVTRVTRSVQEREDKIINLLGRTKRSMTLFAYGCTLASLLAIGIAAVAIFLN